MKTILIVTTLILAGCFHDDDGESGSSIEIDTISGAKHTLSGVYDSTCFVIGAVNSRHDTISVNDIYADYVARIYPGVTDCSNTADISTIQVEIEVIGLETTTGWNGDQPDSADGLGVLDLNEPITLLNFEVLSVTGTEYTGVFVGLQFNTFFVADDGDPGAISLYEGANIGIGVFEAKSTDPFRQ